jgi:hypothetical protein
LSGRKVFSIKTDFNSVEEANEYLAETKLFKLNSNKRSWLENQSPIDISK